MSMLFHKGLPHKTSGVTPRTLAYRQLPDPARFFDVPMFLSHHGGPGQACKSTRWDDRANVRVGWVQLGESFSDGLFGEHSECPSRQVLIVGGWQQTICEHITQRPKIRFIEKEGKPCFTESINPWCCANAHLLEDFPDNLLLQSDKTKKVLVDP